MAGIQISVKADLKRLERFIRSTERKVIPQVAARTLNKVGKNVQVQAAREIKEERRLKISVIKKALKMFRATVRALVVEVRAIGRVIPLKEFGARQTKKGVTVNVTGKRKLLEGAFLLDKFGRNVFTREGRARLPIKKLFGPSIPSAFAQDKVISALRKVATRQWPKTLKREFEFAISKLRKRK